LVAREALSNVTATDSKPEQRPSGQRLRIGLLLDGLEATKYVFELAQWAGTQPDLEISHLIIHGPLRSSRGGGYRALSSFLLRGLVKLEALLLRVNRAHRDHLKTFRIDELAAKQLAITPIESQSDCAYRFSPQDVDAVKALDLDILIRCGSGKLRGDILSAARLGAISLVHGHGAPAGFWETYHRADSTGFTVLKLTGENDEGVVLKSGAFTTQYHYLLNQAHASKKSNEHLKEVLKSIAARGVLPEPEERIPYNGPVHRCPDLRQTIVYACKIVSRIALKVGRRALGLRQRWSVSFIHDDWQAAAFGDSICIPNPSARFLADPFLYERQGKTYCFVEEYDYRTARGHISVYEIRRDDAVPLGRCLQEPFHLSFPFLFTYQGELYMCPEASESMQIRIYRCVEFPLRWDLAAVLMDNTQAADTMLFERDGKWWMLTNIDKAGIGDLCAELYLFSAASPLDSNWTPHPLNPLYIDSSVARNAGLLIQQGRLFRGAQRQGFDLYGAGLSIFEITTLTEADYREQRIVAIAPDFKPSLLGTHHLSTTGATTVIDHLSISFVR
jgi:hypothetical protein